MSRKPMPYTVAIRDRILAILRDEAPLPISTPRIRELMANGGQSCASYMSVDGTCPETAGTDCGGWCWLLVYPNLRAMVELGLVEQVKVPNHRVVYWRYVEQETNAQFNAVLEKEFGLGH
jgi:hypothetical protein